MFSFQFLTFNQLAANTAELLNKVYKEHEKSKKAMSDKRASQLGLIRLVMDHLIFIKISEEKSKIVELLEEEKSKIITDLLLYIKDHIKAEDYSGIWYYIASPEWSTLYKNIDLAIGVGDENELGQKIELDAVSKKEALIAVRNYLFKYDLLHVLQLPLEKLAETLQAVTNNKEQEVSPEAVQVNNLPDPKLEEIIKIIELVSNNKEQEAVPEAVQANNPPDPQLEEIRKIIELVRKEKALALKLFTVAGITAEIGKTLRGAELDKKITMKPTGKHAYWKDEIHDFDKSKLKPTTTRMVQHKLRFKDDLDPINDMRNADGTYDQAKITAYKTDVEPILETYDDYENKILPQIKVSKVAEDWELGRDSSIAHEGVTWKKVKEGDKKQPAAWLPEAAADAVINRKVRSEEAGKPFYVNAEVVKTSYASDLPAERSLKERLYDEFPSHSLFNSKVKQQLDQDNRASLKHVALKDIHETTEPVVEDDIEVIRPRF